MKENEFKQELFLFFSQVLHVFQQCRCFPSFSGFPEFSQFSQSLEESQRIVCQKVKNKIGRIIGLIFPFYIVQIVLIFQFSEFVSSLILFFQVSMFSCASNLHFLAFCVLFHFPIPFVVPFYVSSFACKLC